MTEYFQRGLTEAQNEQVLICSLAYTTPNWQARTLHNMNAVCGCKIWSLPIGGRVFNLLWRAGHFLPQILHTRSHTDQSGLFFMVLEKHIIATKMKENG